MVEAKATARHEKMAKAKKDRLEQLQMKLSSEKASIGKTKSEYKAKMKDLPKEERPAMKEKLDKEIEQIKVGIEKTKGEIATLKAEIKADKAKAESD